LKLVTRALQLDQLLFAEWSPISGTEEQDDQSVASRQRGKRLPPARLIAAFKRWCYNPNGKTGFLLGQEAICGNAQQKNQQESASEWFHVFLQE